MHASAESNALLAFRAVTAAFSSDEKQQTITWFMMTKFTRQDVSLQDHLTAPIQGWGLPLDFLHVIKIMIIIMLIIVIIIFVNESDKRKRESDETEGYSVIRSVKVLAEGYAETFY